MQRPSRPTAGRPSPRPKQTDRHASRATPSTRGRRRAVTAATTTLASRATRSSVPTPRRARPRTRTKRHEYVYIVYDAAYGPEVTTGTTYGMVGTRHRHRRRLLRCYNGATGAHTAPAMVGPADQAAPALPGHRRNGGSAHVMWWDSRNDPAATRAHLRPSRSATLRTGTWCRTLFTPTRPVPAGRRARQVPQATRLSTVSTNPNFEQYDGRKCRSRVTTCGSTASRHQDFGVWTDWRDTVPGTDTREAWGAARSQAKAPTCTVPDHRFGR